MTKFILGLARTELIISVISLIIFFGYLGFIGHQKNSPSSSPSILPTTQK